MDLCLPENWKIRAGGVFRDDLGPQLGAAARPLTLLLPRTTVVCGLRDWRVRTTRPAPVLRPYCAPAWVLAEMAR